jgi:hypothetical protein
MATLPLGAALTHGAVVASANWPVVLIHFVLESFYRLALAVPILGGAVMVGALAGAEPQSVVGDGLQTTADFVVGALATAPVALTAFFLAMAAVGIGGQAILFALETGTMSVIVSSERNVAAIEAMPIGSESLRVASAYSLALAYDGARRFGLRALRLALWFGALYAVIGAVYLAAVLQGLWVAVRFSWVPAWSFLMLAVTAVGVVAISAVKVAFDLLQVVIVTDDCSVREAAARLRRFVTEDSRQVLGIFSVMGGLVVVATAASVLAAAGLAVVAWMPFVSLVVVPLQAAAWVARGLVFQFMQVVALAAYQTQYRRFSS